MTSQNGKQLLQKLRSGTINREERALLESWYLSYAEQAEPFDDLEAYQKDMASMRQAFPFEKVELTKSHFWPRIAIAAAVLGVIFGAGLFFYQSQEQKAGHWASANGITPGKQGATLTLANGQTIRLNDAANGELANQAGVSIHKSKDGQLIYEINASDGNTNPTNTLSTARGETYQVRLPDGSLVWLNAGSSLTYHTKLKHDGKRKVSLSGEGYFEVAKDKLHPFIVETRGQQIAVLGTHFNVHSYTDEQTTTTTLLEGSVRIAAKEQHAVTLKPGQQAKLSGDSFAVEEVDTEDVIAWKNGLLVLNGQSLESIMKQASRWYDVDISFEEESLKDQVFRGSVSRFDNISQLLEVLESTGSVHFKLKGRRVIAIK